MYFLSFCTCPDQPCAAKLAEMLVKQRLAACVNIIPGVQSVYLWQGELETAQEHLLVIKSQQTQLAAIEAAIKAQHPYQTPEIISLAIDGGSAEYLNWIDSCLHTD